MYLADCTVHPPTCQLRQRPRSGAGSTASIPTPNQCGPEAAPGRFYISRAEEDGNSLMQNKKDL